MRAFMRLELFEPLALKALGPQDLTKALRRLSGLENIRISFEPIEGEIKRYKARRFPSGERRYVLAIKPGIAELEVEIEPPQALLELQTGRPLKFYRKLCHEARIALERLVKENAIRLFKLPDCGLVNLVIGRFAPYKPKEGLRLRRDSRGFRHTFGLARISITLRNLDSEEIMDSPQPLDTVRYLEKEKVVRLINQRKLPESFEYFEAKTVEDVAYAIKTMVVRGAPAIGITAAYGMKLFADTYKGKDFEHDALEALEMLRRTRPTGKNLFRALEHIKRAIDKGPEAVIKAADEVVEKEKEFEKLIADHSLRFVEMLTEYLGKKEITFHTHCNAGRLATYGLFGTATAPIYVAHRKGYRVRAIADETRPVLQGARLTAWELTVAGIETRVIPDTAIGFVLMKGMSDVVVVGADRVCKDRSVVNKIGTYTLATLARKHNVPVVVVAPTSTFDECTFENPPPIEERDESEVRYIRDAKIVPDGAKVLNYAFDITPSELINYVISEQGIHEVNPL